MRLLLVLGTYLAARRVAGEVTVTPTIDPNSVPASTRSSWCTSSMNVCSQLCSVTGVSENTCDPSVLGYKCVCANGQLAQLEDYAQTIPSFVCQEAYKQCVASKAGDLKGQQACKDDIQNQCGTKTAQDSSSGSSTGGGTSSRSGATSGATGTDASSRPTSSGGTSSSSSSGTGSPTSPQGSESTNNAQDDGGGTNAIGNGNSGNSNGGDGLSTPAKAGIGIGVTVGVLLIGGNVAYCIWHYRKNRTPKGPQMTEYRYPGVPELGGNPRSELQGQQLHIEKLGGENRGWIGPPRELGVHHSDVEPAELSPQAQNVELEGGYPR